MAAATPDPRFPSFDALYQHLLTLPAPLLPPGKATVPEFSGKIAALSLHPTLEAALHLLNNDLPAAHFLVRHMQSAPAYEGMFLHGILHRIEGDYDNARAWYENVQESSVFQAVWTSGHAAALDFIGQIEALKHGKPADRETLAAESVREINDVVEFCRHKFGAGEIRDARDAFVQNDERIQAMSNNMTTGEDGFRTF